MQKYTLTRDGKCPLAFVGSILATESTHSHEGGKQNRYHDVTIYQSAKGKIVVQIEYITHWQGERGAFSAHVCNSTPEAVSFLESEDGLPEIVDRVASALGVVEEI